MVNESPDKSTAGAGGGDQGDADGGRPQVTPRRVRAASMAIRKKASFYSGKRKEEEDKIPTRLRWLPLQHPTKCC